MSTALRQPFAVAGRVAGALATVALSAIAVLLASASIATHFAPAGQLLVFGRPVLIVLSGSMSPAIRTGDLVIDDRASEASARSLRPGQVITYLPTAGSGTGITHRIVAIGQGADGQPVYVTKGDANPSADIDPVSPAQVVGTVRAVVPWGGVVINSLHQPLVVGLLLTSLLLWSTSGPLRRWALRAEERPMPQA